MEECVVWTEEHVFVRKMFTNGFNVGLPLQAWGKWKNTESVKEKVPVTAVSWHSGTWKDSSSLISLKKVLL